MTSILLALTLLFDVRGVVTDPVGRPVEGAQVTCGTATATTDASGAFTVAGTADCSGTVAKEGFANATVALKAASENQVTLPIATLTERIVVSATGAPVTLEEAGVSGTVFTEKELAIRQYTPVSDLLRDVGGLTVVQTGSSGGVTSVFARGGNSNTTLILLDGIPLTDPGGAMNYVNLTSAGLGRIETVRGPQGALYGAEASSGIIQMFSKQGDLEAKIPHGTLAYERGSFSTDRWTAGLGGGLGNRFDYYLTVDQNRSTGQFPNNIFRITTGTANVGYKLSNSTSIRGTTRNFDSITGTPGATFYKAYDLDGRGHDQDRAVSVKIEDTRNDHFSQRAYYAYHQLRTVNVNPISEVYSVAALLSPPSAPTRPGTPAVRFLDSVVPLGTPGAVTRNITVFGGGFQAFTDRSSFAYQGTVSHRNGTFVFGYENERQAGRLETTDVKRRNNGLSLFEQLTIKKRIFLSFGARLEHSSVYGGRFAPRGAVTFLLPTNTYLRLSLARGIQEPTLLQTNSPNPGFPGNPNLRPERTTSFEAGLTRQWLSGRVRTELAYFRNNYSNLIQFQSDPVTFVGSWFNVDKANSRGLEASGSVRAFRAATFSGSYTRLNTRWVSGTEIGQQLTRRPPNSGTLSMTLAPEGAKWNFLIGARFVGERRDTFTTFGSNRLQAYQYAYLNASVQVHKHAELYIRVNNLSNENYQEVTGFVQWNRNATGGIRLSW